MAYHHQLGPPFPSNRVYGEGSPVIQPHPNPPGELCNSQQDPLTHVVCVDNESLHSNPSSGVHQYPTPFIKQEHGLYHLPTSYFNHEQYHYSTPFIKQEPGVHHLPTQQEPGIHQHPTPFIKQEPGVHQHSILQEPGVHHLPTPFIKQEPGVHQHPIPFIKQEPGIHQHPTPFIKQEPGVHQHPIPFIKQGIHQHPTPFIKQEPGVHQHPIPFIKQGIHQHPTPFIKQEPGVRQQFPSLSSSVPFPPHSIDLNYLSDIEDIITPISSQVSIESIQHDLSNFEGPSGVKGSRLVKEEDPKEPPYWREQYENIRTMRASRDAPVDKYGCFMNAETDVTPEIRRYQVLVSLMLSSQTKDEIVAKAMVKLKENGLTINSVIETPQEEIAKMIFPVGFWNKKSEYVKRTTQILHDKFNSDIPANMEGLISLPGIGPKMAHLIMDFAWGEVSGIAVDTHVHRITHRLGWMTRELKSPEEARRYLEKWCPRSEWSELNLLFVGFGQQICNPIGPKCSECLNKDICPSSSCMVSMGLQLGLGIELSKGKKKTKSTGKSRNVKKIKLEIQE